MSPGEFESRVAVAMMNLSGQCSGHNLPRSLARYTHGAILRNAILRLPPDDERVGVYLAVIDRLGLAEDA